MVPLGGLVSFDPQVKDDLTDVVVSNEDVVQVKVDPTNPKLLQLTGRTTGLRDRPCPSRLRPRDTYDIVVQPDLNLLRNIIKRTVPTAQVEVSPGIGHVIILSGYVTSPQDADVVQRLAINAAGGNATSVINALQVGGVQQVQIDVVIARVNRQPGPEPRLRLLVPGQVGQVRQPHQRPARSRRHHHRRQPAVPEDLRAIRSSRPCRPFATKVSPSSSPSRAS